MHRLALLLLVTAACANTGDEGFEIVHNLTPGEGCLVAPGGTFKSRGTVDVISPDSFYLLTPEISSRISAAEGTVAQRTIALRGARVEVFNAETNTSIDKFTSLFAASLPPLGSVGASFEVIRPQSIAGLNLAVGQRVQLLAKVTAYGALGGSGDEIDSVPFEYPITACVGCVVDLPMPGACPLQAGTPVIEMANPCNPFQDGAVTCCQTSNGTFVCPAPVATAAR